MPEQQSEGVEHEAPVALQQIPIEAPIAVHCPQQVVC
jgi:hypothetical protein